jgi:hypothetical protein
LAQQPGDPVTPNELAVRANKGDGTRAEQSEESAGAGLYDPLRRSPPVCPARSKAVARRNRLSTTASTSRLTGLFPHLPFGSVQSKHPLTFGQHHGSGSGPKLMVSGPVGRVGDAVPGVWLRHWRGRATASNRVQRGLAAG